MVCSWRNVPPPAYVRWAYEQLSIGAGDTGAQREVAVYANCLIDDTNPDNALSAMNTWMQEFDVPANGKPEVELAQLPYIDELMARRQAGEDWDPGWLQDINLCGSTADVHAGIERLADAGASRVILVPHPASETESWLESISNVPARR